MAAIGVILRDDCRDSCRACVETSPPEVDRIWGIWGPIIISYPKPCSIYLGGTIGLFSPQFLKSAQSTFGH